jgi:hypothetical protein
MNSHSRIRVITEMLKYAEFMFLYLQEQQQMFNTVFGDLGRHLDGGYAEFVPSTTIEQLDKCLTNISLITTCLWHWHLAAAPPQNTTHDCSKCTCSLCILILIERLLDDFIDIREEERWWLEGESSPDPQDTAFWHTLQVYLNDEWKHLLYILNLIVDSMLEESQRMRLSLAIFTGDNYSSLIQELTVKLREIHDSESSQEEEVSNAVSPFETPNRYAALMALDN